MQLELPCPHRLDAFAQLALQVLERGMLRAQCRALVLDRRRLCHVV